MKREILQSIRKAWLVIDRGGFSLVEVILSVAIFALLAVALIGAFLYGQEATMLAGNRARATMLAEEGLEAVRNIRDANFSNLTDGAYGLNTTGNQWNLSGSNDLTDIFTRAVTISTIDSHRKNVTANVSWQQNPQRTGLVTLTSRLTYWLRAVFDWSAPIMESSLNLSNLDNALKIQVQGSYAYIVRSSGTDFAIVNISNPASPSLTGSLSLAGTLSNIFVLGNYAFITSNSDTSELIIVNISIPASPSVVGTFNNVGNANATGVYVVGNTAYMTLDANNEFSIINISTPALPVLLSSLDLSNIAREVIVSGNYAYIASADNSQELQVVNISNPLLPTQVASLNLSGNTDAFTVSLSGSTLFLGQGSIFYTINITIPATPSILGSVGVSDVLNDIALNFANDNTYAFIATSADSLEFQIIDVSIFASPVVLGSVNTTGTDNLNGIAYDAVLDRAFGVSASDAQELFIFAPQ